MPRVHLYSAYGITIASEVEFPELEAGSGAPDIAVRLGTVPECQPAWSSGGISLFAAPDVFILRVEGVARYLARAGREVVVSLESGASPREVRRYFLGLVLTAILRQRGVLVLHASGVVGARGAVLFAGHSGDGKSTLLAALASRGHETLGDDAVAVTERAGQLFAHPGFAQVNLWEDAATRLGHVPGELGRLDPGVDKYAFRLEGFRRNVPAPLAGLYVLSVGVEDEVWFEPIVGSEAFHAVRAYTRNVRFLEELGMLSLHFRLAAAVAARVPIVRIARPRGRDSVDELVAGLESYLRTPSPA